ncbi:P-loop containing nucleoside triphosphate hydrolase protein, partial [Zopfochytrium polystomum]
MLPMADGLLVVIDDEDGGGIPLEAEEMLRRAVADRIKPVVIIDRLEKAIIDQSMSKDDLYAKMYANIESINDIISIFADETVRGDMTVCPIQGSVAFGSNLHGWAFTLHQFAARYSKKFGIDKDKMIARLWGDHFFDPATKAWTTRSTNNQGMQLERAFCMFVLDPVYKLVEAVNGGDKGALSALLEKLGVQLMPHEWDRTGRALVKTVLRRFLPATDTLLNMICVHLPSPSAAQLRRGEILYTGPQQDDAAMGIRTCDPDGPLMVYVAKMIPTAERGRFYALARVFSGTLRAGQSVRIQGSKYIPGKMDDLVVRKVQELFAIARSNDKVSIDTCPAGSIVAIAGIDKYLPVTGTLTASESSHSLRTVAPPTVNAFQVLVDVSLAGHLSRFMEDLKVLTRSDPYLRCDRLDSGEVKMATSSEGHLQRCLSSLSDTGVTLTVGEIHVPLRETVLAQSSIVCMAKSPNKHARVYMTAAPLGEALAKVIEEVNTKDRAPIAFQGDVAAKQTLSRSDAAATRESAVAIAIRHGWPSDDAHNIWCFAPDHRGANLLVDRRHLQPHASRTTPDPG